MSGSPGPTVYLTGAAHGIVRATAEALAARGYRLGLVDRDGVALEEVAAGLRTSGFTVAAEQADVTDLVATGFAFRALESAVGPLDVLVAGAGIGGLTLLPNLNPSALRAMLDVNVVGVANAIDAVLPGMIARGKGHIVGISSVAGYRGLPWMASYSASKAALTAYLEGLRPALKRRGVSITTLYPGFVRTALTADTPFRKPVKMLEPEEAARYIVRAIDRRPRDFVFPFSTAFGMGLLRRMPDRVFDWMMDRAGPRALTTDF
jgi:short-subunit dehydrogenase